MEDIIKNIVIKLDDWNKEADMRKVDMEPGDYKAFFFAKLFVFLGHIVPYTNNLYPGYEPYKIVKFSETEDSEIMIIKKDINTQKVR